MELELEYGHIKVPQDILNDIFSRLTSEERWYTHGVSKAFDAAVLTTSMKLYPSIFWINPFPTWPLDRPYEVQACEVLSDYHLTMIVKPINVPLRLRYACAGGSIDVVALMINLDVDEDHGGSHDVVYGADYEDAFNAACACGQIDVVMHMLNLDLYGINLYRSVEFACAGGHLEVIIELVDLIDTGEYQLAWLSIACWRGHIHIMDYLCELMPMYLNAIDELMVDLGRHSTVEIIKYMMEKIDTGRVEFLASATKHRRLCVIKHFAEISPITDEELMRMFDEAGEAGDLYMIKYFVSAMNIVEDAHIDFYIWRQIGKNKEVDEYFNSLGEIMSVYNNRFELELIRKYGGAADNTCKCVKCTYA